MLETQNSTKITFIENVYVLNWIGIFIICKYNTKNIYCFFKLFLVFANTSDKEQEGKHQYKQHMDVTQSKQIISFNKNYSYIDYDLFKELKASWFIWQKNIYINDWVTE